MRHLSTYVPILILCSATSVEAQSPRQGPRQWPAVHRVDQSQAQRLGIRRIAGSHLELFTDLPPSDAVDELPLVFDLAVDKWIEYFGLAPKVAADWHVQGYLIRERAKFASLGVLPAGHEDFVNGYALPNELWLAEQQSDYYRRHLFLHEGTHAFMLAVFGSAGPGWYMEGMAELLATHRWEHNQLTLGIMPPDRESVPLWGRTKIVRDAVAAGKPASVGQVLTIDNRQSLSVKAYAWSWALAYFLESQPQYADAFHKLPKIVDRSDFNQRFRRLYRSQWSDLEFDWIAYTTELDYGYEAERAATVHREIDPSLVDTPFVLAADRAWQATPWRLEAGQSYRITAEGRYQIADDGRPWPCEPGGVTLRYHAGHPLGMLLGVLRPLDKQNSTMQATARPFAPIAVGLAGTLEPAFDSQLYLRVNDSCSELSDNQGALTVRIERLAAESQAD